MRALILDSPNRTATLTTLPLPSPGPNELLIAVRAIALNPVDALYTFQPLGSTGRVIGSDFAGLVIARGTPAPSHTAAEGTTTANGTTAGPVVGTARESGASSTSSGGLVPSRLRRSSTALSASIHRGDRVAGFLQGACSVNDRPGAFAEFLVCPADLVWRIPAHVPFEAAAAVSLCGLTAAQALFFRMGLAAPFQWETESEEEMLRRVERAETGRRESDEAAGGEGEGVDEEFSFFVAGASTSVGMYVAQLVRRSAEGSGKRVQLIGAASPRNWAMLKEEPYGYDVLVDYRDASWPEQVRRASGGGGVHFAYDAISEASTVRDVSTTLRRGGKMAVVRSREAGAWDAEGVVTEPIYGAVWEGLGEDVVYHKFVVRTSPAKKSFATAFYKWLSDGGLLHPNPVRMMPGGFDKVVPEGLALLGTGVSHRHLDRMQDQDHMRPISGEKLVYKIEAERRGSTGEGHIG